MTNYIVLDRDDIRKINEDRLVVSVDRDNVKTVICSEKAFERHKRLWDLEEGKDLIEVTKGE
jgi:hypothetical protein